MAEAGFAPDKAVRLSVDLVANNSTDSFVECVNSCYAKALCLLSFDYAQGCKDMRGLARLNALVAKRSIQLSKPIDKGLQNCGWTALLNADQAKWCSQRYDAKVNNINVTAASVEAAPVKAAPVEATPIEAASVNAASVKAASVKAALVVQSCPGLESSSSASKAAGRLQALIAQLEAQIHGAAFEAKTQYLLLLIVLSTHMWALRFAGSVKEQETAEQQAQNAEALIDVGRRAYKFANYTGRTEPHDTACRYYRKASALGYFNSVNTATSSPSSFAIEYNLESPTHINDNDDDKTEAKAKALCLNADLIVLGEAYLQSGEFEQASTCFADAAGDKALFASHPLLTHAMFAANTAQLSFGWKKNSNSALENYKSALRLLQKLDRQLESELESESESDPQSTEKQNKGITTPKSLVEVTLARASIFQGIGTVYAASKATWSNALKWFSYALKHFRQVAHGTLHEATTNYFIGNVHHNSGSIQQALVSYSQALIIVAAESGDPGSLDEARVRCSCGSVLYTMNRIHESHQHLQKALAIVLARAPASLEACKTHGTLGMVLEQYNLMHDALQHYEAAIAAAKVAAPNGSEHVSALTNAGDVLSCLGRNEEALKYYDAALRCISGNPSGAEEQEAQSTVHKSIGELLVTQKDYKGARRHFSEAWKLLKRSGSTKTLAAAYLLDDIGSLHADEGDLAGALKFYEAALINKRSLATAGIDEATTLCAIGDVFRAAGDWSAALFNYLCAYKIIRVCRPHSHSLARTLHKIGDMLMRIGKTQCKDIAVENARDAGTTAVNDSDDCAANAKAGVKMDPLSLALFYYRQVFALQQASKSNAIVQETFHKTGTALHAQGDFEGKITRVCRPHLQSIARTLHKIGDRLMRIGKTKCKDIAVENARNTGTTAVNNSDDCAADAKAEVKMNPLSLALFYYRQVFALQQASKSNAILQETFHKIGTALHALGDFEGALCKFGAALCLDQSPLTPKGQEATAATRVLLLISVGDLCVDTNNYDGAVSFFQAALNAAQQQRQQSELDHAATTSQQHKQQPPQQQPHCPTTDESCYSIEITRDNKKCKPWFLAAKALRRLGKAHELKNDFSKAIKYYHEAVESVEKNAPESMSHANALRDLGLALCSQQLVDAKGAECVHLSNVIRQKCALEAAARTLKGGTRFVAAEARVRAAKLCVLTGDSSRAAELFSDARTIFEESALAQQTKPYADALCGIGASCEANGDLDEALKLYRQSVAIYKSVAPGSKDLQVALHKTGTLLTKLSSLTADNSSLDDALSYLSESLLLLQTPTCT
jgi:tetratricopeptide (TPR) repeat protein